MQDRILDFFEEPNESAENIKNDIINALQKLDLNCNDIVAYSADNANVNYGDKFSVHTKLKNEVCP